MARIREMKNTDLVTIKAMIKHLFKKEDQEPAYKTIEYHFILKQNKIWDGRTYYVSTIEKKIVGFIGIHQIPKNVTWVSWFGVSKKFQRQGIGSQLFKHAQKIAQKRETRQLLAECGSHAKYVHANKFYKKHGFSQRLVMKKYWAKDDDLILFEKQLMSTA